MLKFETQTHTDVLGSKKQFLIGGAWFNPTGSDIQEYLGYLIFATFRRNLVFAVIHHLACLAVRAVIVKDQVKNSIV